MNIDLVFMRAIIFLLHRSNAADPQHRKDKHDSRDCPCEGCAHIEAITKGLSIK